MRSVLRRQLRLLCHSGGQAAVDRLALNGVVRL